MSLLETTEISRAAEVLRSVAGPVVVVPVHNAFDDVVQCLDSFFACSPGAPLLVVDDASPDQRFVDVLRILAQRDSRTVVLLRRGHNGGFVGACNSAFDAAGDHDVILVNSDVVLTDGWYERMVAAASSSTLVATVSAFTNHGTILSLPHRNTPTPQLPFALTVADAGARVAAASIRSYPSIPTAVGHCVLVTRRALDLLGGFDTAFGRGYAEEVDFSQRAIRAGLKNICADDVFVFHRGGGSFGEEMTEQRAANERIVNGRYPWYVSSVRTAQADTSSPLAVAIARASVALRGLRVAIDGRALGPLLTGTQQVIVETAAALSSHPSVSELQLWIHDRLPRYAEERLAGLHINVKMIQGVDLSAATMQPEADIAYRPYQIAMPEEIAFLRRVGAWVVVNQLDTIAYSNPAYFAGSGQWHEYRSTTQMVFSSVDGIAYLSRSSRDEARAEGLLDGHVAEGVVYNAASFDRIGQSSMPARLVGKDGPFLLVLGVSYHHKNRHLVVRALNLLLERGWKGTLVLAGATPPAGSSLGDEAVEFVRSPALRDHVVQLGAIGEAEKRWLFEHSALLLYPSVVEGFGLVPFEAADYGLACLSSNQTSLAEVLPDGFPTLDDFTPETLADRIESLVGDPAARARMVEALTNRAKTFTAASTADLLVELFDRTMRRAPRRTVAIGDERGDLVSWNPRLARILDRLRKERTVDPGSLVKLGGRVPALKRIVSPDGSKRQAAIRASANRVRRWLRK